jgi:hypothetical protein
MEYIDTYQDYIDRIELMINIDDTSIFKLERVLDELISFTRATYKDRTDREVNNLRDRFIEDFKDDLKIIRPYNPNESVRRKKEGFEECKEETIEDLNHAIVSFRDFS